MDSVLSLVICVTTALLGAFALPKATDSFLKMKYRSMDQKWYRCLEKSLEAGDDRQSRLAQNWIKSQTVACKSGKLSKQRVEAMVEAGVVDAPPEGVTLPDGESERMRFSFSPTPLSCAACCVCSSFMGFVLTALRASCPSVTLVCAVGIILTMICVCDYAARIIPYQLCVAYGVASVLWVIATRSAEDIPLSIASAVAMALIVTLMEFVALRVTGKSAVGGGDRKLIPIITFQVGLGGLMPGLIALSIVALAMAVWALAKGRSKRSYLPFAPPLYAWAALGTLWTFAL